jgi:hypothetical protein
MGVGNVVISAFEVIVFITDSYLYLIKPTIA